MENDRPFMELSIKTRGGAMTIMLEMSPRAEIQIYSLSNHCRYQNKDFKFKFPQFLSVASCLAVVILVIPQNNKSSELPKQKLLNVPVLKKLQNLLQYLCSPIKYLLQEHLLNSSFLNKEEY